MRKPARTYQVVVPSYQRPDGLLAKTLPMLLDRHVPAERITVYLHDHDPTLPAYTRQLDQLGIRHVATSERGIIAQRQRIHRDYPPGTPLVSLDDDLTDVVQALDAKTLAPIDNLDRWVRGMFTETAARDLNVWGVAPVANAFYLKPGRVSEGLKFLMFTLFGFYNRPGHPVHHHAVQHKDDYEFSLRAWWYDGAAVRADGVAVKAEYRTAGGCEAAGRTAAEVEQSAQALMRQWPGLVRRNTSRSGDWPEVKLTPRKRHAGHPAHVGPPGLAS